MAKAREIVCKYYASLGVCEKGREASHRGYCQRCDKYIDTDEMILRKGAVSAKEGEKLLIPINMRDGSLICIGKGNKDWNYSAPHGAGRLMSRSEAKNSFTVSELKNK